MDQYSAFSPGRHEIDLNRAIVRHEKLVRWVVGRQRCEGLAWADVLQVGRIGLWRALQRYDPERGTAFSGYAVPAIERAVWRAVVLARRQPPEELTPHPPCEATDLDAHVERGLSYAALYRLVAALPRRWRAVIVMQYGLAGHP